MINVIFTDEALPTPDLIPGTWYCRVGVVVRPGALAVETTEQVRSELAAIKALVAGVPGIVAKKDTPTTFELSGTRILRQRKRLQDTIAATPPGASGDVASLATLNAACGRLCELTKDHLDIIVAACAIDSSTAAAHTPLHGGAKPARERSLVEAEVASVFLGSCADWLRLSAQQSGEAGLVVCAVPCFDEVSSPALKLAIAAMSDAYYPWTSAKGPYLARAFFAPSRFDPLLQLADVYGTFVRAGLEAFDGTFSAALRNNFEGRWPTAAQRDRLWHAPIR